MLHCYWRYSTAQWPNLSSPKWENLSSVPSNAGFQSRPTRKPLSTICTLLQVSLCRYPFFLYQLPSWTWSKIPVYFLPDQCLITYTYSRIFILNVKWIVCIMCRSNPFILIRGVWKKKTQKPLNAVPVNLSPAHARLLSMSNGEGFQQPANCSEFSQATLQGFPHHNFLHLAFIYLTGVFTAYLIIFHLKNFSHY